MNDLLMKLKSPKDRKGSKPRCHWLTHGTREQVANRLTGLVAPWATVSEEDARWMPEGFCRIEEAQLDQTPELLSQENCDKLRDWWLAVPRRNTRTPNWDIASTCTVDDARGILLVEAKAHNEETVFSFDPQTLVEYNYAGNQPISWGRDWYVSPRTRTTPFSRYIR